MDTDRFRCLWLRLRLACERLNAYKLVKVAAKWGMWASVNGLYRWPGKGVK